MITAMKSQPMYVVNNLKEKQKGNVIVPMVEYLLTQVSCSANTWEKTDRQKQYIYFLDS